MHFSFCCILKPRLLSCDFLKESQLATSSARTAYEGEML
jgi:hypothetical protein